MSSRKRTRSSGGGRGYKSSAKRTSTKRRKGNTYAALSVITRAPPASRGWFNPTKELKFIETTDTGVIPAGTPATLLTGGFQPILLNGSIPGSGATNRIGRKIFMRSCLIRFACAAAATSTSGIVRCMLVYDSQVNGTAFTDTDLLVPFDGTPNPFITSKNNLDNRDRFKVLMDKQFYLSGGTAVTDTNVRILMKYKRLEHPVIYNAGTAGTVADINTGGLFFCSMCTNGTAAPISRLDARVRFSDD